MPVLGLGSELSLGTRWAVDDRLGWLVFVGGQVGAARADVRLSDFPQLAMLELLPVGEPTDRISIVEAKDAFLTVMRAAEAALVAVLAQHLAAPARAVVLADFRQAMPPAVDEALSGFGDVES